MIRAKNFSVYIVIYFSCVLTIFAQTEKNGASPAWEKGALNGRFVIEVFNDYQCPTCASFNENLKLLQKKYPNDILVIFRHFPLIQIHDKAMLAAQATEAAGKQNKFWEMGELLLERQRYWDSDKNAEKNFTKYAKEIGLDIAKFKEDLNSSDVKERINLDIERAKSLKLNSTPSVLLNGKILSFVKIADLEKTLFSNEPEDN